jgi:hypothetical protein
MHGNVNVHLLYFKLNKRIKEKKNINLWTDLPTAMVKDEASTLRSVRYTFLATTVSPPLRNTVGTTLEFKQLFRKRFVNTSSQHLTKKVNSVLLLLFLLKYKQFT